MKRLVRRSFSCNFNSKSWKDFFEKLRTAKPSEVFDFDALDRGRAVWQTDQAYSVRGPSSAGAIPGSLKCKE